MTVNASTRRAGPFAGTGVIVAYPFDFKVFAASDLRVVRAVIATGVTTDLTLDSDYSVALNSDQDADPGGTVSHLVAGVATALPVTDTLTIAGNLPYTQPTDITNLGGFYPQVVEDGFDRVTMLVQQNNDAVERSLQLNIATDQDFDVQMPAPVAGEILGWSPDGLSLQNYPTDTAISTALLEARLASTASASVGAGLVGEDLSLAYAAGTVGWWDRHAGVSLLRYMPVSTWAGIVAGTNTTDLSAYIQDALDDVLLRGHKLHGHGYTYKCDNAVTCLRSSAAHAKRIVLEDFTLDASDFGLTGRILTVGATGLTYFLEDGSVSVRGIVLRSYETADPRDTAATGAVTGLGLKFCGQAEVDVDVFGCYKGAWFRHSFPVRGRLNVRRHWIGLHLDEAANRQQLDVTVTNCRYGVLIRSEDTVDDPFVDSGKSNTHDLNLWIEGASVGLHLDSDAGVAGAGDVRHRGLKVRTAYLSSPVSMVNPRDFFVICKRWSAAIPSGAGADCTEFLSDFSLDLTGGLANPSGGVWSATQALVAFDSTTRCGNFQLNGICTGVRLDADVFRNAPASGFAITSGYPSVSDRITEQIWWNGGAIVRRMLPDGTLMVGAKSTAGTVTQIGGELDPLGVLYLTRNASQVFDFNRQTSDGTIGQFRRSDVSVGSIGVTTVATSFNTSSARWLKFNIVPADKAKAVAAVQSWPMREYEWIAAPGKKNFGAIADEMLPVKRWAVSVDEQGRATGLDWSKFVPEMIVALQYLLDKDGGPAAPMDDGPMGHDDDFPPDLLGEDN